MAHYYLDEIKKLGDVSADGISEDDERQELWKTEREKFGFDGRDTWSLDFKMTEMLYERLNMYLEKADEIVNLSFYTYEFEGKTYTQRELILMMIEDAETFLKIEYNTIDYEKIADNWDHELELSRVDEIKAAEVKQRLWKIWALVQHQMWW